MSSTEPVSATTASQYVPRRIDEYLKEVLSRSGSDLHFIAGDPPRIRLYGELQPLRPDILTPQFVEECLRERHRSFNGRGEARLHHLGRRPASETSFDNV